MNYLKVFIFFSSIFSLARTFVGVKSLSIRVYVRAHPVPPPPRYRSYATACGYIAWQTALGICIDRNKSRLKSQTLNIYIFLTAYDIILN